MYVQRGKGVVQSIHHPSRQPLNGKSSESSITIIHPLDVRKEEKSQMLARSFAAGKMQCCEVK
jgi:hypothetical protein